MDVITKIAKLFLFISLSQLVACSLAPHKQWAEIAKDERSQTNADRQLEMMRRKTIR